jgi:Fe-S-cluster containining protein
MKTSIVKNNCIKGHCSGCGQCCIPWLPITYREAEIIKDYISKHNIKPQKLSDENNYYMDCPFHDRTNKKCTIYEVRPEVCSNFLCCHSSTRINIDRDKYALRADYNSISPDGKCENFMPMDLLFYDNPTTLFYVIKDVFNPKNQDDLLFVLKKLGRNDIIKAIKTGKIKLEWGE